MSADTPSGRSLELYFIDGRPDGMRTAQMLNWTGHILVTPRTQLAEALKRTEARFTGVYILVGDKDGQEVIYVGEGDDISHRIRSHDTSKDWWNTAVLVTTAANTLNKAHIRYLEARLIQEARVSLDNGTKPPIPYLAEAAIADMEVFLQNLLVVLPAVRVDCFLSKTRPSSSSNQSRPSDDVIFELMTPKHNIKAYAKLEKGEFVVQKGSTARGAWVSAATKNVSYKPLYNELVERGVLVLKGDLAEFTENYAFNSPSAAAAVVNGRPANGRTEWRHASSGMTYADWEADQLQDSRHEPGEPMQ